ncbi:pyridoxal phosphate-dependent aminotransferase [Natronospira bacteriovora]|uniref:Aminotransferase n=1 Tax=Natronospira bacteriovora TaxID=3069753 RepID=A0ABU0W6K7_9GAMM|nr:aminotransferase class I/II-fold pyridoxal phosphate-dependent enzyme [Natronospira sp. AB-CW4]MDQ2069663.1 aminotransferase class I/II-fold pyridoxal phosphate-dependent enzyme [Natronospira sp. AB-CW4]
MADSQQQASLQSLDINLNLNIRGLSQSATLAINQASRDLAAQGRRVYRLGLGQSPFPVPEVVTEALRQHAPEKDYLPVEGLKALRQAVADYHNRHDGVDRDASSILIGPGSKELMFIVQLTYYGDLVIPTPSWVSYAPQAHIIGRQIRWVPTRAENDWRLMPEELDRVCRNDPSRPRIIILNYPSNPTGDTYTLDELKELAEVARKYRVVLLSDEIYGELHHEGEHVSIARFYPEGTIISAGLSKWCGAGGWRLGTFSFPRSLRWLQDAMAVVASETFTSTSAPIQYAAIKAFEGGPEIEKYLDDSRWVLRHLGRHLWQRLSDMGLQVTRPAGGFYLFPDFSPFRQALAAKGIEDSETLCQRLLDESGVALLPGAAFGRPVEELTTRLAYVDFDGDRALASLAEGQPGEDQAEGFLREHCERMLESMDAIENWLKATTDAVR